MLRVNKKLDYSGTRYSWILGKSTYFMAVDVMFSGSDSSGMSDVRVETSNPGSLYWKQI